MTRSKNIIMAVVLAFTSLSLTAQVCNNYHADKKTCPPSTDNFKMNGQSRSAMMYKGQKSQLNVLFYDDQDYRITICPEEILGDQVTFKIKDGKTEEVLYNNQDEDGTLIFEFSCEENMRLILEIEVPDDGSAAASKLGKLKSTASGCMGVLIEYMATPRTGF